MATKPTPASGAKKPAARKPAPKTKAVDPFEADLMPVAVGNGPRPASLGSRLFTELLGTFVLMLMGLGIAASAGWIAAGVAPLLVALGFGITVMALIVSVGHISGAHFNPAVTLGLWTAGRFPGRDVGTYILMQVFGAAAAVAAIALVLNSHPEVANGSPESPTAASLIDSIAIGWGPRADETTGLAQVGSPVGFGLGAGIVVEILATALLVAVVLFSTSVRAPKGHAPVAIGFMLAILILFAMAFTNGSLNPARATATWIFGTEHSPAQLWPWWLAAMIAGAVVGLLFRLFQSEEDFARDDA